MDNAESATSSPNASRSFSVYSNSFGSPSLHGVPVIAFIQHPQQPETLVNTQETTTLPCFSQQKPALLYSSKWCKEHLS